jgi:hypothetical protein
LTATLEGRSNRAHAESFTHGAFASLRPIAGSMQ